MFQKGRHIDRLQIFFVKYEYLRSLQLCEDKSIRRKLKRNVFANMCLRSLQLIGKPGFKTCIRRLQQLKNLQKLKNLVLSIIAIAELNA